MKLFCKEKRETGRCHIYFCGIKIFSYKSKKKIKNPWPCCCIWNPEIIKRNNILFPHPVGIVISKAARLGENCVIYQNVTIGSRDVESGNQQSQNYPVIGNNVTIYAGAVIIGPVHIGDCAVIGANAVVLQDVPKNSVAVGVPAKVITKNPVNKK